MHDRMASGTDILYLHPSKPAADFKDYARVGAASPYLLMPVGVPGMINLLREHGFRVTGLNVPMEILINPQFDLATWLGRQRGVSLVAIDLHWYEHAFGALDVARVCKQVYPDVPVVIGGFTASCFAAEILSQFLQVDFIIRGDAERPLLDLARRVCRQEGPALSEIPNLCFRSDGRVVENEQSYCVTTEDLNHLNCVDIDFLVHAEQYYGLQFTTTERVELISMTSLKGHWLTIGRGCRFRCSFCGGGRESHATIAGRGGIVPRSVEQVVDDLARLQRMGIRQVSFNLDPAIMGDAYWSRLFAEMRRRKVRIGIYNECFQLPSEDFLREFVETAEIVYSELAISPLSGSEKVRQLNGKHFTNSQLLRVLSILRLMKSPSSSTSRSTCLAKTSRPFDTRYNWPNLSANPIPPAACA